MEHDRTPNTDLVEHVWLQTHASRVLEATNRLKLGQYLADSDRVHFSQFAERIWPARLSDQCLKDAKEVLDEIAKHENTRITMGKYSKVLYRLSKGGARPIDIEIAQVLATGYLDLALQKQADLMKER